MASSGYGSTYQVNHAKPMDRTKLRKNGLKAEQTSAGTGKTSNTSLSSNPSRVRLQKNAAALSRVSEKKIKRKETKGARLPIISNA